MSPYETTPEVIACQAFWLPGLWNVFLHLTRAAQWHTDTHKMLGSLQSSQEFRLCVHCRPPDWKGRDRTQACLRDAPADEQQRWQPAMRDNGWQCLCSFHCVLMAEWAIQALAYVWKCNEMCSCFLFEFFLSCQTCFSDCYFFVFQAYPYSPSFFFFGGAEGTIQIFQESVLFLFLFS